MRQNGDRISIGIFETLEEVTGGRLYRTAVVDTLARKFDVEVFKVGAGSGIIPSARLRRMVAIAQVKKPKDIWIRDFYPVVGMSLRHNPGKNICLFLHLYTEGPEFDLLGRGLEKLFFRNVLKCSRVVVIADFWKEYLAGLGITNVTVIRNGIDTSPFQFTREDVEEFRKKHRLTEVPIVYIGNCRENKGVVEAYEALKDKGYHLVTSGEPNITLPCPNFNVSYREYLLLLKASSAVVTMSKFREGWCRTAHEAMLCKTPVIGSGTGGMAELLEGGKQFICRNISELPLLVETAISQSQRAGEDGYKYACVLTVELFENSWMNLIEEVMQDDSGPE